MEISSIDILILLMLDGNVRHIHTCGCIRSKDQGPHAISEIPDHATFREKENTLGWLDKLFFF